MVNIHALTQKNLLLHHLLKGAAKNHLAASFQVTFTKSRHFWHHLQPLVSKMPLQECAVNPRGNSSSHQSLPNTNQIHLNTDRCYRPSPQPTPCPCLHSERRPQRQTLTASSPGRTRASLWILDAKNVINHTKCYLSYKRICNKYEFRTVASI